jgi:hypothetical protein
MRQTVIRACYLYNHACKNQGETLKSFQAQAAKCLRATQQAADDIMLHIRCATRTITELPNCTYELTGDHGLCGTRIKALAPATNTFSADKSYI